MGREDDQRGLAQVAQACKAIGAIVLLMHCYYYLHEVAAAYGYTLAAIDGILLKLNRGIHLFAHPIITKAIALIFLMLGTIGDREKPSDTITWMRIWTNLAIGCALYFGNWWILNVTLPQPHAAIAYTAAMLCGYFIIMRGIVWVGRILALGNERDPFNIENESFLQETRRMVNEYSINIPTLFYFRKRWNRGWLNVVNPFRASMVLGTPGSGKSFAIVNSFIRQMIEKGFSMYLYDFKFPDLSTIAFNHLRLYHKGYTVRPTFYVINFDDPRRSHRCNPISPKFMTDISDAYESAYTIMLNLNRTWIQKQGDFFVESPINLLAAVIWYLRIYRDGKYCTLPHAIELINQPYEKVFTILTAYDELANYLAPFRDALEGGAQEQLQGQIASAKVPLTRLMSPALYWVMTGDDFSLDINNPKEPKILAVGNNPDRQNIYSAALGLYNSRIVKLINKKGQLKSGVIIDELPTIYFRGLDNLIATARSNKVAVCLGFQDFSQLNRDYGDKESKVIQNTVGNVFSGQVVGDTADLLSKRFGKIVQRRTSVSINQTDTSTSISSQLDSLIPASKISTLTQGRFVGAVADDFGQEIDQKIFHAKIVVDIDRVNAEQELYQPIPIINPFLSPDNEDILQPTVNANYRLIKRQVAELVSQEMERIENDPNLAHLIIEKE